jgi:hypothetical protein
LVRQTCRQAPIERMDDHSALASLNVEVGAIEGFTINMQSKDEINVNM